MCNCNWKCIVTETMRNAVRKEKRHPLLCPFPFQISFTQVKTRFSWARKRSKLLRFFLAGDAFWKQLWRFLTFWVAKKLALPCGKSGRGTPRFHSASACFTPPFRVHEGNRYSCSGFNPYAQLQPCFKFLEMIKHTLFSKLNPLSIDCAIFFRRRYWRSILQCFNVPSLWHYLDRK